MRTVQLNHTAVHASDRYLSAEFLAAMPGLRIGAPFGPFLPVDLGNGVTLDYHEKRDEPIRSQHYAFLVPDERFASMLARPEAVRVTYYADPAHTEPGRTNHCSADAVRTSPTRTAATWRSRPGRTSARSRRLPEAPTGPARRGGTFGPRRAGPGASRVSGRADAVSGLVRPPREDRTRRAAIGCLGIHEW
ncbi:hypothetical protein Shyhy01_61100 [Streptomyces hygroscopicus subsp. hygroscopicus]|nr:hypothetical protein Shyhy01_61100 [Streptomyces hygroscopicus subsp. hygroscopicus]